jgi:hypothetical protein
LKFDFPEVRIGVDEYEEVGFDGLGPGNALASADGGLGRIVADLEVGSGRPSAD